MDRILELLNSNLSVIKMPSFFVVGAQKAGTTSLHEWLKQQTDVNLPIVKETHFFNDRQRYKRGLDWYFSQFPKSQKETIFGEIDPQYMFYRSSAIRIKKHVDSPKFIFILRNPVERAYSNHLMSVRRGYEDLGFVEALEAEAGRLSLSDNRFALEHQSYLARGTYAPQLGNYIDIFPNGNFMFVKFDDMVSTKTGYAVYAKICDFIGVKSSPRLADRSRKSNSASEPRSIFVRNMLYRPKRGLVRKAVASMLGESSKVRISMLIDKLNQSVVEKRDKKKKIDIPCHFKEAIIRDLETTSKQTKLNLEDWAYKLDLIV